MSRAQSPWDRGNVDLSGGPVENAVIIFLVFGYYFFVDTGNGIPNYNSKFGIRIPNWISKKK
jgi:hypothetical protein